MERISLKNMAEEQIKERKRRQKNEAQKRYYQSHKEYYKNYSKEHNCWKEKCMKISEYVDKMYDVIDYKDYPPYLDEIYYVLHPELKGEKK